MKRYLALFLLLPLCLGLFAGCKNMAEEPATVLVPEAYKTGNGVINGYYAATAPIIVNEGAAEDADALLDRGYVVVEADDLTAAIESVRAGSVPGDPDMIVLRGSTAAAEAAANGGVYAAQIIDPIVDAETDADAVAEELSESAYDYAMSFAVVSITEASNSTVISSDDAQAVEAAVPGVKFTWSAAITRGGPPAGMAGGGPPAGMAGGGPPAGMAGSGPPAGMAGGGAPPNGGMPDSTGGMAGGGPPADIAGGGPPSDNARGGSPADTDSNTKSYGGVEVELTELPAEAEVPIDAEAIVPDKDAPAYVRVNWDLSNMDGSYTAALGLAESFRDAGSVTQFNYIWDNTVSDTEAFCDWVDRICKFERAFTMDEIETTLDLGNSLITGEAKWTLSGNGGYYVLSGERHTGVVDIARPELADYQGVSVAVPAAYVNGINVNGTLDINREAAITNANGMTYTAATAPIVMQTGATGYSVKENYLARADSMTGYITVEPGNRGKYSRAVDAEGNTYWTGDAPLCTTDQKSVVRWLRYNSALGYIPGDIDRIVTWGGSGGGAHATLICAGESPYYAEYLYHNGALGVDYTDGGYVYIDGFSDSVWGSCPGGAVTNLEEANMLYEFETWLSTPTNEVLLTLEDGTPVYVPSNLAGYSDFYKLLSYYMVMEFVDYYQTEQLTADLDGDGVAEPLTLAYDPAAYPETSGLHGSYVDYFMDAAEAQLEWYLNNIEAATNNTYANENGESDVEAFLNGHYTYISTARGPGASSGAQPGIDLMESLVASAAVNEDGRWEVEFKSIGAWEIHRGRHKTPLAFDAMDYCTENEVFGDHGADYRHWDKYCLSAMTKHYHALDAAYGASDSKHGSFADLYEDFANDCIEIVLGQEQSGKVTKENIDAVLTTLAYVDGGTVSHDIVWMYNPMNLFLDGSATLPAWVWTVTGGADSDSSNLVSMNDALALAMHGVDAGFAWTWGAGHGSNTPLNTSQNGMIDRMMEKYAD